MGLAALLTAVTTSLVDTGPEGIGYSQGPNGLVMAARGLPQGEQAEEEGTQGKG